MNSAECSKCNTAVGLDERFEADEEVEAAKLARAIQRGTDRETDRAGYIARLESARAAGRVKPLEYRECDTVKDHVRWALYFCREAKGTEDLRRALAQVVAELSRQQDEIPNVNIGKVTA